MRAWIVAISSAPASTRRCTRSLSRRSCTTDSSSSVSFWAIGSFSSAMRARIPLSSATLLASSASALREARPMTPGPASPGAASCMADAHGTAARIATTVRAMAGRMFIGS